MVLVFFSLLEAALLSKGSLPLYPLNVWFLRDQLEGAGLTGPSTTDSPSAQGRC